MISWKMSEGGRGMRSVSRYHLSIGVVLLGGLLGGCSATEQPESYRLPMTASAPPASLHSEHTHVLWLSPIAVSSAIDQAGLVWRRNDVQMQVLRDHQWAEPLPEALTMALAPQLETQLPGWRVSLTPEGTNETLAILVTSFNAGPAHDVEVAGRWRLTTETGQVHDGAFQESRPLSGDDWDGVVRSLGQTWSRVAELVAEGVAKTAP